jgi:hypothetical protein
LSKDICATCGATRGLAEGECPNECGGDHPETETWSDDWPERARCFDRLLAHATKFRFGDIEAFEIAGTRTNAWGVRRVRDPIHTWWTKPDGTNWARAEAIAEAIRLSEAT